MKRLTIATTAALSASAAAAETPRVVADIAPVHALVSAVMDGIGTPDLVIPQNASPHGYALRPSEAAALDEAGLVVWIGPGLIPQLGRSIENLAGDATVLTLTEVPGTTLLDVREGATFEAHSHDDHDHAHDEHGHGDDHAHDHDHDHAHEDDHDHGHDHAHEDDHAHDHGHDHAHGEIDFHAWLDPANAATWLDAIAAALAEADPQNADLYRANAEAAKEEIASLEAEIEAMLAPVRGEDFIVFHDAYHYFEARFGLEAAGSIAFSDATAPSAARLAELRDLVAETGISCAFAEPQFDPGLVEAVIEEEGARVGVLDPIGIGIELGPDFYPALLRGMAQAMADCLES